VQRALLVMILSLLLAAGGDLWRSHTAGHASSVHTHDCCPHSDAPPVDGDDDDDDACCDIGCHCTCAAGIVALSPARAPIVRPGVDAAPLRVGSMPTLLTDHERGPPPTPPPIG